MVSHPKELSVLKKYEFYEKSVQNPEFEVEFLKNQFINFNSGKSPKSIREDFAGTALLSYHWIKDSKDHIAYAVDIDESPLNYGKEVHLKKCDPETASRIHFYTQDVLKSEHLKADMVISFNFSYFIFKEREKLLNYFKSVYKSLSPGGLFWLDIFGGIECHEPLEEETDHTDFVYYWDCDKYNPLNHHALYKIHFKDKKSDFKYEDVFVYDWRIWSVPEVMDILKEAGFENSFVFWEGEDDDGSGDGNFQITKDAENCESWVAYLCGQK